MRVISRGPKAEVTSCILPPGSQDERDTLSLPQVLLASSSVARSINTQIAYELFEDTTTRNPLTLLKRSAYTHERPGLTSMEFRVTRNDSHLVSIEVLLEAMGAYPSSFSTFFSFDLATGRRITFDVLFTAEGIKKLTQEARRQWRKQVNDQLVEIEDEDSSEANGIVSSYLSDCIASNALRFPLFTRSNISFDPGSCLPHVSQADDIDWKVNWPIEKVRRWLRPYGRSVLGIK